MEFILYAKEEEDILMMYDGKRTYFPTMETSVDIGFVRVTEIEKEKKYCSYVKCQNIITEPITLSDVRLHVGTEKYYESTVKVLEDNSGNTICKLTSDDGLHYYCISRGELLEIRFDGEDKKFNWLEKIFSKEQVQDNHIVAEEIVVEEDYFLIESIIEPKDFYEESTISLVNNKVIKIKGTDETRLYVKDDGVMLRLNEEYSRHVKVHEERGLKDLYKEMYKGMFITYSKDYRLYDDKPADLDCCISTELWVNSMCYFRFDRVVDFIDLPCIRPEYFKDILGYLDDILNYCKEKADLLDLEREKRIGDVTSKHKFKYKEIAKLR